MILEIEEVPNLLHPLIYFIRWLLLAIGGHIAFLRRRENARICPGRGAALARFAAELRLPNANRRAGLARGLELLVRTLLLRIAS